MTLASGIRTLAALSLIVPVAGLARGEAAFKHIATNRGVGVIVASAVAEGPEEGSERLYLSYLYVDHTLEILSVDPNTGRTHVFPNPVPGESGARCVAVGADGALYFGTLPHAHLLKLDPKAATLIDLGRPAPSEQYIWDLSFGADGKLYGATYPNAKLVRYDPASNALEDLGSMAPGEQYAHYVATSPDGFVYVGTGTSKGDIVAYEIGTGAKRSLLAPAVQQPGQARVHRGADGKIYGRLNAQFFRIQGWTAEPIARDAVVAPSPTNVLKDGRELTIDDQTLTLRHPERGSSVRRLRYAGNRLSLFRITRAGDGRLYASSALPMHLLRLDEEQGTLVNLGTFGEGEIYSFLALKTQLMAATYGGIAPLLRYRPGRTFRHPHRSYAKGAHLDNPALVQVPASNDWRPQAMIEGPDGHIYIGAVSGYGKLGGPLVAWNPSDGTVTPYPHVVPDQSVVTLTSWKGLIAGGTSIAGGGGSHPTQSEARIFLWDPTTRTKLFDVVPVPGAAAINDLVTAPNGLIYGFAGKTLFVFNAETRNVEARVPVSFLPSIYNAMAARADGSLWGLAATGIFRIDPSSNEATLVAESPRPITGGFAMDARHIYFTSGPEVWRWTMPKPARLPQRGHARSSTKR